MKCQALGHFRENLGDTQVVAPHPEPGGPRPFWDCHTISPLESLWLLWPFKFFFFLILNFFFLAALDLHCFCVSLL